MGRLWLRVAGYVIIRVKGSRLEAFLNMANREGISLWNVSRPVPDRLYCWVSVDGFRRLRPVCRALHLSVDIRRRRGLPFIVEKISQRRALVVGVLLFLLGMYILSGHIWFLDLSQVPVELRSQIEQIAASSGLRKGVPREEINPREVERQLLLNIDSISWASVRVQGTAAFIEVVEKTTFEADRNDPSNIVAAKSGLVKSVITFSGLPIVQEGHTVREGDVLISGVVPLDWYISQEDQIAQTPSPLLGQAGEWGYLFADGLIDALTWYEARAEVVYSGTMINRTGKRARGYRLSLPGGIILTLGRNDSPFVEFVSEDAVRRWVVPGTEWSFELQTVTYYQLEKVPETKDRAEATREALIEARSRLRSQIPGGAKVMDEEVEVNEVEGRIIVHLVASILEKIGVNAPITVGDPPPSDWEGIVE